MSDDFSGDINIIGTVAVGGTAEGNIDSNGDRDWFEVDLVAGRTYTIDLRGSPTDDGTLSDPRLYGIHDAAGNLISGTANDDWGGTYNSQVTFTATASGTYYIAAGAYGSNRGTYELEVTDKSAADDTRAGATDLGDITELLGPRFPLGTVDADADGVDYYRFTLTEAKQVGLGLRRQDANADLFLEDADGTVLYSSTNSGTANEAIEETLLAGTYYVRVQSQEAGENAHVVRYGVSAPDADALAALQQQSDAVTNAAPAFGQQGYTFDLAENADGSTDRVSLGTVSATDPEGVSLVYSLVGDSGSFEIDESTGELFYNGSGEDFESGTTQFTLTVRASDGSETVDTTVTVNLTDVNETPAFAQASYAFDLAENADGSTDRVSLGTVAATDPEGASLAYSLVGASGSFEIDEASGELFYKSSGEDYESGTTEFTLTVRASDGSGTVDTTVTVNVTDVAEAADPPASDEDEDEGSGTPETVSEPGDEDFSADTSTTGRVAVDETATGDIGTARDRDWFAVELVAGREYQIDLRGSPTDDGTLSDPRLYGVHDAAGSLIARTANDDGGEGYNSRVTFTATGSGTHYIEAGAYGSNRGTYELEVTDKSPADTGLQPDTTTVVTTNEAPTFGQQGYAFHLAENADGSTDRVSLGTVAATDPEDATLSYSLVGDSGSFEIDEATGELFYTGSGEDYETDTTRFTLTVRASDGSETADTTVTVNVTDVEETVPEPLTSVSEPGGSDLPEDTSTTGRVAVDETATGDIGTARDRDWFAVELVAGREYQIDLRGSPTDDGTLSDPRLYGVHDAAGSLIARTANDDGGEGYNSRVTFTATGSGTHYIEAGAYGSNRGTYELEVTDKSPADTDSQPDTTTVVTTNEAPTFGQQGYAFHLAENADGSTDRVSLGTVAATDPEDATLSYSLVGDSGSFEIDEATGELFYTGSGEDYETDTTRFTLTVRASDGSETADTTVTVNVTDVEETVPEPLTSVSEPGGSDLPEGTSTTGRVAVDGTAAGEIQRANDRDWFAVELEAGKTYQIDLSGVRSGGGTLPLPHLRGVYDADGGQIPGIYDPFAFSFANPHNRLGEGISVDVQVFPGEDSKAFFAPDEDGTYYLAVGNFDFSSTGTYTVGVTEIEDDFLRTVDTTGRVEVGSAVTGEIQYANDRDWFAVELTAGVTYKVGLLGEDENGGTLPNPWIRGIHDANGRNVSDTSYYATDPHSNSELIFRPNEDGTYYVAAGSYMSGNGEEEVGTYTLQVSIDDTRVDSTGTSEPDGGDLAADTSTIGRVAVGGSGFGEIGTASDRDWFAVELEAGKTYRINTDGVQSGGGTLARARLHNVYDADGNAIPGIDDEPITWRPIHYLSPQEVRNLDGLAFFTPDEDGTYYLEVGSGYFEVPFGGSTGTGTYSVGVAEMEDDYSASIDTTGAVEVGGTVTGQSQYEIDRDWFAVELTAGETYKVELLGTRAKGGTLPQPYIWGIHDADGHLISGTSDYAGGPHRNSQVFFTPDEDGTYYVAAGNHESGSLADDLGTYTLQVSIDDFTDDIHTTGTLEVGGSVAGEIEAQGDRDWFAVALEAGKTYQLDMEGSATGGGTLDNPTLYPLRDTNGNVLHFLSRLGNDRDSGEGLNSRATFTVDEGGTYYVVALSGGHLHAVDSHGRSIGTYTLSLQEVVNPSVEEVSAMDVL